MSHEGHCSLIKYEDEYDDEDDDVVCMSLTAIYRS